MTRLHSGGEAQPVAKGLHLVSNDKMRIRTHSNTGRTHTSAILASCFLMPGLQIRARLLPAGTNSTTSRILFLGFHSSLTVSFKVRAHLCSLLCGILHCSLLPGMECYRLAQSSPSIFTRVSRFIPTPLTSPCQCLA